jgi:hypothetical protein
MDTPEILCALRNEIIESQKTQAEFLKWKLIAVSAVGSISLGFTPVAPPAANLHGLELLLCAIPLICAYIDFVSLHVMIRIVTIGTYLKKIGSEYESFVFLTRERGANPFIFETAALHGSSFVFNLVLIGISFTDIATAWVRQAYLLGGVLGVFVAVLSWIFYTMRAQRVFELAKGNS